MKFLLLIFSTLCTIGCNQAQHMETTESRFEKKTFTTTTGYTLPYRIYIPKANKNKKNIPMLCFLHGAGERGTDNSSQLVHVANYLSSDSIQALHSSILIFPQCPKDDYWAHVDVTDNVWTPEAKDNPTKSMIAVIELLQSIENEYNISQKYIAGLSMGGFGTFDLIARDVINFSGAIAICGGGDLTAVEKISKVPLHIFHGAKDPVVPVELSRTIYEELKKQNKEVYYTEYPNGSHDVWNQAMESVDLLNWLFSKK